MKSKDPSNNRHVLTTTKAEKDLGVVVDSQLTFKDHVSQTTSKANKILGVIRRSFDHLTEHTFIQLYKALVRPVLEYGHSVWQPSQKNLQREIEDVQRRATKLKDKPNPERLSTLKLPSLEHGRRRGDMIDLYKYITGIHDTSRPNFELHDRCNTRGHSKNLCGRIYVGETYRTMEERSKEHRDSILQKKQTHGYGFEPRASSKLAVA
ncbi:uncharacterized protein LOC143285278 [Babylonia areolata]|uniref:uncharacterized protein LOC143285278 n=1 Tax=Babylonia areolata TaxID=304850 RepID=UPI003FD090A7